MLDSSLDGSSDMTPERERDAQADASDDTSEAEDGGSTDARTEPGRSNYDELKKLQWKPLSWAPAKCNAQVATDVSTLLPEPWTLYPDLPWEPKVASNATACARSEDTWGWPMPSNSNERLYHLSDRDAADSPDQALVVFDTQGKPKLALRYRSWCGLKTHDTASSEPCYSLYDTIACGDLVDPALVYGSGGGEFAVGDDLVATNGGTSVTLHDRRDPQAKPTVVESAYPLERLAVHGPTVLSIAEIPVGDRYRRRLVRSDHGGEWEILRRYLGREVLGMVADESQIAWIEVDSVEGDDLRSGTLFTALWPAPGAPLLAKRVREIDGLLPERPHASRMALRHGYFAYAALFGVRLYRMSDGARWDVPLPQIDDYQGTLLAPVWMDDTYVTFSLNATREGWRGSLARCPIADVLKAAPSE